MGIKQIEYTDANGKSQVAAYASGGAVYQLGAKRERFAQQVAQGREPLDVYCEVWQIERTPDELEDAKRATGRLLNDTTICLRIQELKRPVLRKLRGKIEYNLQKALEQCEVAWDVAYLQADVKGMLAAVKMQAELSKLLSQQIDVNHRHGLLDDEQTEVLLAMQKEFAVRHEKKKALMKIRVVNSETVRETPHQASFVEAELVPSGGSMQDSKSDFSK